MAIKFLKRPYSAKGPNVGKKVLCGVVRPELLRVFMNELNVYSHWRALSRPRFFFSPDEKLPAVHWTSDYDPDWTA